MSALPKPLACRSLASTPAATVSWSPWFSRLGARSELLEPAERAPALLRLAPQLRADEPAAAAVAALTVAGVFPKSWPRRRALALEVLANRNTIDELVTALVAWLERGRAPSWIANVLRDPTSAQRHAARRRAYVQVGRGDPWQLAGVLSLVAGSVRSLEAAIDWTERDTLATRAAP